MYILQKCFDHEAMLNSQTKVVGLESVRELVYFSRGLFNVREYRVMNCPMVYHIENATQLLVPDSRAVNMSHEIASQRVCLKLLNFTTLCEVCCCKPVLVLTPYHLNCSGIIDGCLF